VTKFEPFVGLSSRFASCHTEFMAKRAVDISQLSAVERLALIEELWESLDQEERDAIPLTPEQEAELDRRLDALDRDGVQGLSPQELREFIKRHSP
jgi:putative addiction module component (TIGR02574 family)